MVDLPAEFPDNLPGLFTRYGTWSLIVGLPIIGGY